LSVLVGLACQLIGAAIFPLPVARMYHLIARIAFAMAVITALLGLIFIRAFKMKKFSKTFPRSISNALESIEDIVFTVDRDGIITHINHPEKLSEPLRTIHDLHVLVQQHCITEPLSLEALRCLKEACTCEMYFENTETHLIFRAVPIPSISSYAVVLEDVSDIRHVEKKLKVQNEMLNLANERLTNYIKVAGELEAEKERLQILTQIQENLIHDIEKALSAIHHIKQQNFEDNTYGAELKALAEKLRQIYQKVRNAVGQIAGKEANI
jgi:hypothetical protein